MKSKYRSTEIDHKRSDNEAHVRSLTTGVNFLNYRNFNFFWSFTSLAFSDAVDGNIFQNIFNFTLIFTFYRLYNKCLKT